MAKNYNDIQTAVYTDKNKMDFGNSIIRGNGVPLDITEVYNSYASAVAYVNSNPVAYEGQLLAVTENNDPVVYVIAARLGEDGVTVEHYLKEVGSVPDVDGKTIVINSEGQLEAVIPEYVDTNTTYKLNVAPTTEEDETQGVKITLTPYDGETAGTAQSFIIADPDLSELVTSEELSDEVDALTEEIGKKANSADVYTKSEVYTKEEVATEIGTAVAGAAHLKRVVVDDVDSINVNDTKALEYIYLVPSGLEADDNKFYEYIVIEVENEDGSKTRKPEKVGSWEVKLDDYLKITDASTTYLTKTDAESTYATQTALSEAQEAINEEVAKKASQEALNTLSGTVSGLADTKADKSVVEGISQSLATKVETSVVESLTQTVNAKAEASDLTLVSNRVGTLEAVGAEKNVINGVNTATFSINENRELQLVAVPQNQVSGLTKTTWTVTTEDIMEDGNIVGTKEVFVPEESAASLADILVPAAWDGENGNSGLMTAEQAQKLSALVLGDNGNIEISGKVNADNVVGLNTWIKTNRDSVDGLYPVAAAELLGTVASDVETLKSDVATNAGLVTDVTNALANHITNDFNPVATAVGNLETLTATHTDEIAELKQAMTWGKLDEPQV